jgi:hypothetical protein
MQDFPNTAFVVIDAKFSFDNRTQIDPPPPDKRTFIVSDKRSLKCAVRRPLRDQNGKLFFLFRCHGAFCMSLRSVPYAINPLGVVPDHPRERLS